MRRLLLGVALVGALVSGCAGSHSKPTVSGSSPTAPIPQSFRPETGAAFGARDIWLLGEYRARGDWRRALIRSTDAGRQFTRVRFPPSLPSQGTVPALVFADSRDGYAYVPYGGSPLFSTHDGGQSWRRLPGSGLLAFTVGGGRTYAVWRGSRGFARSTVSRDSWFALGGRKLRQPISLAARGSRVWMLRASRTLSGFSTIAISSKRGRRFSTHPGPCLEEFGGRLVPAGGGVVWAVCPSGMMASLSLSTNGGRTFAIRSLHDPGGVQQPSLTNGAEIAAPSPRTAVLYGGGSGPLYRTTDAGLHWVRVAGTAGLENVYSLAFSTSHDGIVLATTRSHPNRVELWQTTDGGLTWRVLPLP